MDSEDKLRDYLRRATTDLRATRRKLDELTERAQEPIAIVGMGCRFAGDVRSPDDLWRLVASGGDAVSDFPTDRGWPLADLFDPDPDRHGRSYVRQGAFLSGAADFDADFFEISPREALAMDPQQRLLLETSWEALEHAGIPPRSLRGSRTAVYAGLLYHDYSARFAVAPPIVAGQLGSGSTGSMVSGRIAYTLGLTGPALTVDTACSSSLVALHLAVRSLRSGECTAALVGGVTVMSTPGSFVEFSRQRGLAPDGRCKAFAAGADGTAWGEGVGVLVLERLSDAQRLGHDVLAVVRGSAVNSDGASNGFTAPNGPAQQRVIVEALADARLSPRQVDVVEAHGTGTTLGDPIEAEALLAAYGAGRERPLLIGSVKSNLGHTQAASGMAGMIKMVQAMAHGVVPPSLHVDEPTPAVDWSAGTVRVVSEPSDWPDSGAPRRAGVSSFGVSGTNAHVVLEQAPSQADPAAHTGRGGRPAGPVPVVLSARTSAALRAQAGRWAARVRADEVATPLNIAFSAANRTTFEHRAVVVADDRDRLAESLEALAEGGLPSDAVLGTPSADGRTVFVFPGQGSQWTGMAVDLIDRYPAFAERLTECAETLRDFVDWSLVDVLRGAEGAPSLGRVDVVQPALFAVMVSLAALWRSHGVEPVAVVGHSQGEIAAACVAGALSLPDAARAVTLRSRALLALSGQGGMASVALGIDRVEKYLAPWGARLAVAAANGPSSTVVSGDPEALAGLLAACAEDGVRARSVPVDYASHSAHVEAVRERVLADLAGITPRSAEIPFFSTVTGDAVDGATLTAGYWYDNLRRTVRFEQVVRQLVRQGHDAFVEVSAHPVLTTAIRETVADLDADVTVTESLRRGENGAGRLALAAAELHVRGTTVDWQAMFTGSGARRVPLPAYAFQHRHYWLHAEPTETAAAPVPAAPDTGAAAGSGPVRDGESLRALLSGRSEQEAGRLVLELVCEQVAAVLRYEPDRVVDPGRAVKELGFDSLTAVDLRNRLVTVTGLALPVTLVFDHPTASALAQHLCARVLGGESGESGEDTVSRGTDEAVAIIGMACRFPGGVGSPESLWRLVESEVDILTGLPADRDWDLDALYHPDPDRAGRSYVRGGYFLDDAAGFDAEFFGISPREAVAMDPQHRLLLETAWEAVERAGIAPDSLAGSRTGVFTGVVSPSEYLSRLPVVPEEVAGYHMTGTSGSVASGRVAYTLGATGPAITVDTACSSSLVAVHLAMQALRRAECSLALAGGVNVLSAPSGFTEFSRQRALAADGRCKAFASAADGTGWGEGVGMLLLAPLSAARRNGYPVLAVLRGSSVNSDGASNGLTAPSGPAQQRVIRQALADAGLTEDQVDAVEAHGTGTALGDPIEANALLATYGAGRAADRPLWLGSLKSNLGHTAGAAGVAGVIKMVQALRHGVLPRTLHVDEPTRQVDWSTGAVRVLTEARSWPQTGNPRRAGVSAFGVSGTNAHVILEQAPSAGADASTTDSDSVRPDAEPERVVPWVLSARTAAAVRAAGARLLDHLATKSEVDELADVAGTLAEGRSRFAHRAVVLAGKDGRHRRALAALAEGRGDPALVTSAPAEPGRTVFVLPGQGSQWAGMAVELLDRSPEFGRLFAETAAAVEEHVDWRVTDVLRALPGAPALDRVDVVQPTLFAVHVALAGLWRSAGLRPDAVVGHSQGEVAAACVAGALSLADAARIAVLRARLLAEELVGRGALASIALSRDELAARLTDFGDALSIAGVNGPRAVTVAGPHEPLDRLIADLTAEGVPARIVAPIASHTAQLGPLRERLLDLVAFVRPADSPIPMYSTVSAGVVPGSELTSEYWFDNVRRPVDFDGAVRAVLADGFRVFVECSAHPVLTTGVQDIAESVGAEAVVVGTLRRGQGGPDRFTTSVAEAWVGGAAVDWSTQVPRGRRADLPTYPFQHTRFWLASDELPARSENRTDATFWNAVDSGEPAELAATLGTEASAALAEVLPVLSAWRTRRRTADTLDALRYRATWQHVPDSPAASPAGTWLALVPDAPEAADWVRNCLRALDVPGVTTVRVVVDAAGAERTGLAAQLAPIVAAGPPAGVVSLVAVDERPSRTAAVPAGLAASAALVQALADLAVEAPLWCLTRDAVSPGTPDERDGHGPRPAQATVWGLGMVAALELPERWGGLVDVPGTPDDHVVGCLRALLSGSVDEDQVVVRPTGMAARRLVRAPAVPTAVREWRPRDTVLITGGTGAIGAHVARWLAGAGARRLVLTGLRGPAAPGAAELAAELTATGVEVEVVACDVADRDALAALVERLRADGPPVRAVMHAAGTLPTNPLVDTGPDEWTDALAAKAWGAAHLDALFATDELDAFVLFSSIASVWGSGTQAAYASANAFLDALAQRRRAQGRPATSVAWGAWAGQGMAVLGGNADHLRSRGLNLMAPELAIAALAQALDQGDTSVAITDVDWERFLTTFVARRPSRLLSALPEYRRAVEVAEETPGVGGISSAGLRDRLLPLPETERDRVLLDLVRGEVATVLGHAEPALVDPARALKDLGFDSLTSVELRNRLGAVTGLRLPATLVFDQPTSKAIAGHLRRELLGTTAEESAPVLAELDRVEAELPALDPGGALHAMVTIRLRTLLSRLDAGHQDDRSRTDRDPAAGPVPVTATDDELFRLIDMDLDIS